MKELVKIQMELKAPKNQKNKFGNYNYRSCEDILEAVKPIANKLECSVILNDEVVVAGDRIYIKATATILNKDGVELSTSALAREPLVQKGMSESQLTGTASSYARKYALNGLFAIDDTKDDDTKPSPKKTLSNEDFLKAKSFSSEQIKKVLNNYSLTGTQIDELNKLIK